MTDDLEVLRERYDILREQYVAAAERSREALGEPKPIGSGPVPMVSREWIEAVEAERAIQPEYEAARDAYWKATQRK